MAQGFEVGVISFVFTMPIRYGQRKPRPRERREVIVRGVALTLHPLLRPTRVVAYIWDKKRGRRPVSRHQQFYRIPLAVYLTLPGVMPLSIMPHYLEHKMAELMALPGFAPPAITGIHRVELNHYR